MISRILTSPQETPNALARYYFLRAGVSIAWVIAAFTVGAVNPIVSAVLLILYPAWDALANARDARDNGGFRANPPQALNTVVSMIVALAVAATLPIDAHLTLGVFGVWAILAGLLQLGAGVRRRKVYGAQWAMILSGGQSALAGGFMIVRALGPTVPTAASVAPYAAFGAFYFLISAILLTVKNRRRA